MTEEDAKTKWCPHAVASHTDPRAGFREDDPEHTYRHFPCLASACMAWRVAQIGRVLPGDEYKTYRTEGFCGLAGAPQ